MNAHQILLWPSLGECKGLCVFVLWELTLSNSSVTHASPGMQGCGAVSHSQEGDSPRAHTPVKVPGVTV